MLLPGRKAAEQLGVSQASLRRWGKDGRIKLVRLPSGQRRYDISTFVPEKEEEERPKYCYCRVSSRDQKEDLQRQIEAMQQSYPHHIIVSDIALGINFKRKGLQTILRRAMRGEVKEVVVAHRDRLCRFAFELVEWILREHGVKLVVCDAAVASQPAAGVNELTEDLLAIVQVFCCRVNGRRKYKKEKGKETEDEGGGDGGEDSQDLSQ